MIKHQAFIMSLMYMFTHGINLTIYSVSPNHPEAEPRGILLIKLKTKLQNECLKYQRELQRAKELGYDGIKKYRDGIIKDSETDFCWIAGNYPKLVTTWLGLKILKEKQHNVVNLINIENDAERHRYYVINKCVQHGYRETIKSLSFELRNVKLNLKGVKLYRTCIIKELPFKKYKFIIPR